MTTEPSAWAQEKAKELHDAQCRNAFIRINGGGAIDDEYKSGCISLIARAFDSALSEQAEAVRVLAEFSEEFFTGSATGTCPCDICSGTRARRKALESNEIANAAVSAARRRT